jgi:diguanylate cyclase (GGDEF)-like protein
MFDIDNFKQVNDSYGHAAGDLVLRTVTRQCLANIREIDILGRYGGDEFIVLLPECKQEEIATLVAERLRTCIENYPVNIGGGQVRVTISLGITISSPEEKVLEDVFHDADQALYAAKVAGKNLIKVC